MTRYNSILTLASTDIFTQRGYPINDIVRSPNYTAILMWIHTPDTLTLLTL
jgi:hypothetical protein